MFSCCKPVCAPESSIPNVWDNFKPHNSLVLSLIKAIFKLTVLVFKVLCNGSAAKCLGSWPL